MWDSIWCFEILNLHMQPPKLFGGQNECPLWLLPAETDWDKHPEDRAVRYLQGQVHWVRWPRGDSMVTWVNYKLNQLLMVKPLICALNPARNLDKLLTASRFVIKALREYTAHTLLLLLLLMLLLLLLPLFLPAWLCGCLCWSQSCPIGLTLCSLALVWAHLSVSNTKLVHIIIRKLTFII